MRDGGKSGGVDARSGLPSFQAPLNIPRQDDAFSSSDLFSPEDEDSAPPAMKANSSIQCPLSPQFRHCLVDAKSSAELCEALIHVVLGWFSFYQAGYLHRDISIRSVFLFPSPVQQPAFEISADFRQTATKSFEDLTFLLQSVSVDAGYRRLNDIENQIMRVERLVQELGVSTNCSAFIIDSDMATPWATCLDSELDIRKRSGNLEFVSSELAESIECSYDYLQSPVDDLFSIYWVALWAILNNVHTERSEDELRWRMKVTKGYLHRGDASADICKLPLRQWKQLQQHSPILQQWSPVLKAWFQSLDRLEDDWRNTVDPSYDVKPGNSPGEYYLPHFHYFALRGVADFLEMIQPHITQLRAYPPFV